MSVLASTTNESISTALQKGDLVVVNLTQILWNYVNLSACPFVHCNQLCAERLLKALQADFISSWELCAACQGVLCSLPVQFNRLINNLPLMEKLHALQTKSVPSTTHSQVCQWTFFLLFFESNIFKLIIMIFWNTAWKSAVCIFKGTQSDHPRMKQMESWGSKNV